MLQTIIRKVPDGKTQSELMQQVETELCEHFSQMDESCEDYYVGSLNESNFENVWSVQETYKNTPDIKEKYKKLAKDGKLIYVEIDY